jgi:hypothetical protein
MRLFVVCALSFVGMTMAGCSAGSVGDLEAESSAEQPAAPDAEVVGSLEQAATVAAVWQCHYEHHDQPGKGWYYCCESGSSVCISRYDGNNTWGNYVCNF